MVRTNARPNDSVNTGRRPPFAMLEAIAYTGMFVFGIVMALLGAVMPVLSERGRLALGDVGTLFLVTNAGMLAASLIVGPALDRFGFRGPLALGAGLVGLALAGIARAPNLAELFPAVACLGFGGGILNAGTNTLVADLHEDPDRKASALNLLGVFFGFGALILPFSIGALLSRAGLGGLLAAAAAACLLAALVTAGRRFPPPKQAQGWPLSNAPTLLSNPLVLALAALLFFQSGNEFVLGGYFSTFLTQELGQPVSAASYLLAAYWASIMVARLFLSRVVLRLGPGTLLLAGALLAAASSGLVAIAPSAGVAVAGILVTGVALAGVFPGALAMAGSAFREQSGTVFGILFTVALTGGMTMPWLAGQLAQAVGLRAVFVLAAGNFLAVVALAVIARRQTTETQRAQR